MVSVTVLDPSGSVVPGAQVKLVDVGTNDIREGVTQDSGAYTFRNLSYGSYKLTVSKEGFETKVYEVTVNAGRTTDLTAALKVGSTKDIVEVEGGIAPVVETSSSATNMTIDTKQIENLPLQGRDITSMARLSAGYNGTWNGLPTHAQSSSIDGVVGQTGRWKYYSGADGNAVSPRVENIAEMVVSTNQLDLNSGFGTSSMTITYVTRRGTNDWHGRIYEDFRNDVLNATAWNQTKKSKLRMNEFGGSIGGPVFKDKMFFFGSFSMMKRPNSFEIANQYFLPAAKDGIYKYYDAAGQVRQVNVFSAIDAYNAANPSSPLPSYANRSQAILARMAWIESTLGKGQIRTDGFTDVDPNISGFRFRQDNQQTNYYPTIRLDYNISQKHRLNLAYNQTETNNLNYNSGTGWWPGDGKVGSSKAWNAATSVGLDSTITPTFINQLRLGFLYSSAFWTTDDRSMVAPDAKIIGWNYSGYNMSGQNYFLPTSRLQPIVNIKNDATWVKGKHTFGFGFTFYRDKNTYWDALTGIPEYYLGINESFDPAATALTSTSLGIPEEEVGGARQLYAILAGRVNYVQGRYTYDPSTGKYAAAGQPVYNKLNELMKAWGFAVQDSFKVLPNLTLNYGIRWDFNGPNKDLDKKYHSISEDDFWAVSGRWNLFNPGSYRGIYDPVATVLDNPYDSWHVTPQPAFGIAWQPRSNGSFVERLLGGDKTVIRAGYQLRRFTPSQQFVWDTVSNYSMGLFQEWNAEVGPNPGPGVFTAGSVTPGGPLPALYTNPLKYEQTIQMTPRTFGGAAYAAIDPNIRQPYLQSWNLSVQRDLGRNRALEVRYIGNRTIHQWIAQNVNEVNIYENGFLNEFKNAQANLAINRANGVESFANLGRTGQYNLPIMTAAGVNFSNASFITNLARGAAGSFAQALSSRDYFCNMVGASFAPCAAAGYTGANKGYPLNFFVANPYAIDAWMGAKLTTDAGYSNYNGLQVEFRQQNWHGLTATANYTWSKTLGMATAGDWTGGYTQWSIRNNRSSYVPAGTDRHHVININATYDLPFGKGRAFLNNSGLLDRIVGGWTIATIYKFQTGAPFRIDGQYNTVNGEMNGGVVLNGVTAKEIQDHVGVYQLPSTGTANTVYWLEPDYAKSLIQQGKLVSNQTAGAWGQKLFLYGPHQTFTDIAVSKSVPITERVRFKFQAEMLNAFNHPLFVQSNISISPTNAANFGKGAYVTSTQPRNIEFRANIEF